uniref:LAGLIDADG endonuclease n=1 Tax=Coniothyrium glycines TaxID=1077358 RepID=A0A3G4S6L5_9PLEO|nr:LAGLIDADG endonuclease [Coniothyrium glycines]AYU74401.1 LAGLIDADG endonuclease [Coniothyrium glycines]
MKIGSSPQVYIILFFIFYILKYTYNSLSMHENLTGQTIYSSMDEQILYQRFTLNPWWVTGFSDAKCSFNISILKSRNPVIGFTIEPCFIINLNIRDLNLLHEINQFFSVGSVSVVGKYAQFIVRSRSELSVIIAHFNEYPLHSTKAQSFRYFCEMINILDNKDNTYIVWFSRIASLLSRLNIPLPDFFLAELLRLGPLPLVEFETSYYFSSANRVQTLNPSWISGFASGKGSFTYLTKTRVNSAGMPVKDYSFVFEISQTTQDLHLLNLIACYFNTGEVYTETTGVSKLIISSKDQIITSLVPHFRDHPLKGSKNRIYLAWLKAVTSF